MAPGRQLEHELATSILSEFHVPGRDARDVLFVLVMCAAQPADLAAVIQCTDAATRVDSFWSSLKFMFPVFTFNRLDDIALIAASILWVVPEMLLAHIRRAGPQALVKDRSSGMAVMIGIWLGVTAAWICAYAAPRFAIRVDRGLLFVVGIALMLAGIAFRWYSVRVLGRFFTVVVAVQPGHSVVERGPYRLIRHPSYSGALLTLFGFGLAFTNWLSLAGAMLFPLLAYGYRMQVEEHALLLALGSDYAAYMKRTKRIIPFVI